MLKSLNGHYLHRYIKFINNCKTLRPAENIEKHHILPISLFLEFKSFIKTLGIKSISNNIRK
jgi:hypothetical protein